MARMDARTIRIAILSSIALLIGAVFAYMYWHAVYGPGSSRHLPMVPMPGQHLPPAVAPALLAALPSAPLEPVIAQPSIADAPPPSSREPLRPDDYMRAEQAAPAPAPAPRRAAPVVSPDNDAIRVARVSKPAQVSPSLQNGFNAYNRGDLSAARQNYQSALRQDANSRDALLGMAALAISDKQPEQAAALYARLLDIDPNDNDALAGLTSLRQGDPAQTESRLKRVLERNPESGSLLFSLGNLYARQGRWPEAQQHYFRAYTSTPNNADYAFNLAVGLDRLNQGKLALSYYQRALELAPRGAVHFDREAAATRARELGGQ